MALDAGAVAAFDEAGGGLETPFVITPPRLTAGPHIGAALKAIREFKGHSLEFIAGVTRVRESHLAAIEAFDLDKLPSRPFAIGYVRAYAEALGQDPEAAVDRFKEESPAPEAGLRNPVGDEFRNAGRSVGIMAVLGLLVLAAVVSWNVTRHVMIPRSAAAEDAISDQALQEATAAARSGPVQISGPVAAPPEASTPAPYVTPGLEAATAAGGSADAALAARAARLAGPQAPVVVADQPPVGSPFVASGQVYGPEEGTVLVQATGRGGLVIVRGGEAVYFARWLAPGEAYRVPAVRGLTVEASNPTGMRVYVGGVYRAPLTQTLTPVSQFGA